MNQPTLANRVLHFATRTAIRILPKEAKAVVKKYKKLRSIRGGRFTWVKNISEQEMPPKSNKKKDQTAVQARPSGTENPTETFPPKGNEELAEQMKKNSIEGAPTGTSRSNKNASNSAEGDSVIKSDADIEEGNNKTRFQKYNIRLEDIIKFREKLTNQEIKHLSLPPYWSQTIEEVDNKAQNEVQQAHNEAAEAQIQAENLKDQLVDAHRHLDAARAKNDKYTKEVDAQRHEYLQLQQQLSDAHSKLKENYEKCAELEAQVEAQDINLQEVKGKYVQERDARTRAEHALKQLESETTRQLQLKQGELTQIVIEHRTQVEQKNDEIANMILEIRKIDENYKEALTKKVAILEEIYDRRYSDHQEQLKSLQDQLNDRDNEIDKLKSNLQDATGRFAALEMENVNLKAALDNAQKTENDLRSRVTEIKTDLENAKQACKDADKELKDKEVKFVVEDLEPEFIKYDGLLMIEEKRIEGIHQHNIAVDQNNN